MPSSPEVDDTGERVELLRLITSRHMVRSYLDQPVEEPLIDALISSAHAGPSAGNTRSLDLLVLIGAQVEHYWEITLPAEKRANFPWPGLLLAPVLLVPYVNPSAYVERYSESDKTRTGLGESQDVWTVPYWWVDGGAASENVLLAAPALGLGACLFGQFEHEDTVRARFGVPDGRRAVCTIAVGHPDTSTERRSLSSKRPRRSIANATHHGHWQGRR